MKNIIYFVATLFVLSCGKEPSNTPTVEDISLDVMRQYLPLEAISGMSEAVFVNSLGEEKSFLITYREIKEERTFCDEKYENDRIDIGYKEDIFSEYSLNILSYGNFVRKNSPPDLVLICKITQFVMSSPAWITILENGDQLLGQYHDELQLANLTFENVYSNYPNEDRPEYGVIYYSKELGVVGFADGTGEIFALKELKE